MPVCLSKSRNVRSKPIEASHAFSFCACCWSRLEWEMKMRAKSTPATGGKSNDNPYQTPAVWQCPGAQARAGPVPPRCCTAPGIGLNTGALRTTVRTSMVNVALEAETPAQKRARQGLILGALGVVYGDIGTSPLYTVKQCFTAEGGVSEATVLGVLSLIAWSLMVVVTVKYVIVIMRADNRGEGGILALTALALRSASRIGTRHRLILMAGLVGAALFYGDGVITPAISVLSAIEGLKIATPLFDSYVIPLTVVVLIALFAIQRRGTSLVGGFFGPVMIVWFAVLAVLGAIEIWLQPEILHALNPLWGLRLLADAPLKGFVLMGAVVLAVTGAEALYADMGHFGAYSIRVAWFRMVFPALVVNYFGQGALLLRNPAALENPFY